MTKTNLSYDNAGAVRPAGEPSHLEQASYIRDATTGSDFSHNNSKTASTSHGRDPTGARRADTLRPDLVFVITFRKIVPRTKKWSTKTPPAILYNLREKSGAKIKN
jgi:hypothetical protein